MAIKSKSIVLTTLVIIVVLAVIAYWVFKPTDAIPAPIALDITDQPTLGNANAPIQITAFEDLKCANCKIYNLTLFPKIKERYIDTGKAKYTLITLAFIPGSEPAANAARCLYSQNPKFFYPFVDYVFNNQPPEEEDWATTARLLQFAKAANPTADLNQFSTCLIEGKYNKFIEHNFKIASQAMNGEVATPSLYVNGRKVDPLTLDRIDKLAGIR